MQAVQYLLQDDRWLSCLFAAPSVSDPNVAFVGGDLIVSFAAHTCQYGPQVKQVNIPGVFFHPCRHAEEGYMWPPISCHHVSTCERMESLTHMIVHRNYTGKGYSLQPPWPW